ncbi:hypothetical protein C8J57DRAFT_1116253 [Mycena rebaudengoi]|nr:hypothetical protein C8J57DRAFT_1116253 [Mycena rebaudengoi]
MPSLAAAKALNAQFNPHYVPVAVFAGGTSGIGQEMAELLARQTQGKVHIILIGRNKAAAHKIFARFPTPCTTAVDGIVWKREFVYCDASSMAAVGDTCAALRSRLSHINFLVMTAGGSSLTTSSVTDEGLDHDLAVRYYSRYLWIRELLPLIHNAQRKGQHARVMSVLGAGMGVKIPPEDINLDQARHDTIRVLKGAMLSFAGVKATLYSAAYNDAMMVWFSAQHPSLSFTHIHPGFVKTGAYADIWFGWLLSPLSGLLHLYGWFAASTAADCAQYMTYGLLDGEQGLFLRGPTGDIVSSHVFKFNSEGLKLGFDVTAPTAHQTGVLNGVQMKGYGGSDAGVKALMEFTERIVAGEGRG